MRQVFFWLSFAITVTVGAGTLSKYLAVAEWPYEVTITVSASLVDGSADFTDMPVYIALSDMPAHFWTYIQSDGDDIRVYTDNYPNGTELPRHLIYINDAGTSGTGTLFTKRTVDDAATTKIVIRYGNPNATAPAAGDANGQYAVWSMLKQGWSLQEGRGAGSGGILQLAANTDHGTPTGTMSDVTGKLEKNAIDFAGTTSDRISVGTAVYWDNSSTFMTWVRFDELPLANGSTIASFIYNQGTQQDGNYRIEVHPTSGTDNVPNAVTWTGANAAFTTPSFGAGDVGTWRHLAYTFNTTTCAIWKDGTTQAMADATIANTTGTPGSTASLARAVDGAVDIPLWFNSVLAAEHILAIYRNQNAPDSYYTVSAADWIGTVPQLY